MSDAALGRLASKAGLDIDWVDVEGKTHKVSPDTLRAVLRALGLPADTEAEMADSEAGLDEQKRHVPPLLTAWAGEEIVAGGASLKAPDAPGYHRIEIGGAEKTLAVAPPRCFGLADVSGKRLAGLGVQLYSLRGGHTAGFGDFAALADFVSKAAKSGIDAIAVSPTHALFAAEPLHISPYSPSSRLFLNPLYADSGLLGGDISQDDGQRSLIDWGRAAPEKFAALKRGYEVFRAAGETDEFDAFCAEGGERLRRHAIFETLHAHFRAQHLWSWRAWPQAYRDAASAAVCEFAREHREDVDYHLFLQFLAARSLAAAQESARAGGMAVGLIADIATGIDPSGSDAWSHPNDLLLGLGIGAPPDLINTVGQGWGLTMLSPTALRNLGFEAFIALLRANMAHAGGVRIDHAMSLMRLWVIPEGAAPTEGAYLRYPMEDLLRLIALESHLHRAIVIGEDLGTVPHGFRDRLSRRNIAGMQVLWFEREPDAFFEPARWRGDAVAMTTTHDLPTVAGWWRGRDIDWRVELGTISGVAVENERIVRENDRRLLWSALKNACSAQGDPPPPDAPEPVVDGAIAYVGSTPAEIVILPIEDVLALDEAPNLPGTIDEHPNWRRRLPPGDPFVAPGAKGRLERFVRSRRD